MISELQQAPVLVRDLRSASADLSLSAPATVALRSSRHTVIYGAGQMPAVLEVTSTSEDGEIMGVRHKGSLTDPSFAPLEGVQFHPESILTEHGHAMLANFLKM